MMATKWLRRAVLAAGVLALSTASAGAITLNVIGGGLEGGNASYGCTPTCTLAQRDYSLVSPGSVTGLVTTNGTLEITLNTTGSVFDTTPAGAPVSFVATYAATLTSFSYNAITGSLSGAGTGSVTGTANGIAFSETPSMTISCLFPGGTGQCGIAFGASNFTDVAGRDWRHTFDLTVQALPEPTTALLLALALGGLALRARSH